MQALPNQAQPVVIDTDPGIDDAIAILLALRCPELHVLGLTTVAGNRSLPIVTDNAARVLALGGIAPGGLPIHAGARGPLARTARPGDEPIHGADGLGDAALPTVEWPLPGTHAVDWLEAEVRARPGELTVIALGPCTNIALLLQRLPDPGLVREIVVMGGSVWTAGNTTPAAEFNFFSDPEAAHYVLQSGAAVRLVGLNVTRRALLTAAAAERLAAGDPVCQAVARMAQPYMARYRARHGIAACAMHDPLAVAAVVQPDLLQWQPVWADVELRGELTRGMLVADVFGRSGLAPNVSVAVDVDQAAFEAFLLSRLLGS